MAVQYKAFISYRHHPEDIAVATQIHRLLERYHVPHELKKQGINISEDVLTVDECFAELIKALGGGAT